ncbi:MAG: hypothetical protein JST38_02635, partial [Bacteroidetes bacterium]|nr:hypothetical protein [Bacteroidota bacterium]
MNQVLSILSICATANFLAACNAPAEQLADVAHKTQFVMDPHSYARPEEAVTTHLDLDIHVDMKQHRITGTATYDLKRQSGDSVIFDTYGLTIDKVVLGDGMPAAFTLGAKDSILGQALRVALPPGA